MPDPTQQWPLIQALFERVLEVPELERPAFLDTVTAPTEVLAEVKDMLTHHGQPLNLESLADDLNQELQTPERLGAYKIIRKLGQGGMSLVYLGQRDDNTFNRQVAIKTLDRVINTETMRARFRHEQRIHARLNHPNIARLLDAGLSTNNKPYLVMQYVNGTSIIEFANTHNYDIKQRLQLITQVCDAIAFAHSQLILHRDIKPSNIMVDDSEQAILLDFGIAKLLDDNDEIAQQLTREGDKLMTLSYASPEQIRGDELGTASDVYSLGVVLYELLCGSRPFYGKGDYQLSDAILNHEAPTPINSTNKQKISRDLQAIVMRAIEKEPLDRYDSAAALAADIRRYLNHEVIIARPPSIFKRITKFWRRNPITAPLGTLAITGIIVSLAAALWQAQKAEQQRNIATSERDRAEQVADLLLDLFDSDPFADDQARRDDITLREFLTSRSKQMENQLAEQPALQAKLYNLFANLYANLGQLKQAEPMAIQAINTQRKIYGSMHLDVARSANTLGTIKQYQARYDEAETFFKEALMIRSKLLPESHPDLANSINNLSTLYYERARPEDQALMMLLDERTLKIREKHFGPESLQVAESLNNIASAKAQSNQEDEWQTAESMYRRALTIRKEKLGDAHANTGNTMSNLANLLRSMGKFAEAETLYLQGIEVIERALGNNHPRLSAPLYGLGNLYQQQSQWDLADPMHQRSLIINKTSLPANHPYLAEDLMALVHINLKRNRPNQARTYLQELESMNLDDQEISNQVSIWQQQLGIQPQ